MNLIENYVYTKKLNRDLQEMRESCDKMYEHITQTYKSGNTVSPQSTLTTRLYKQYNLLLFTVGQFHELFTDIKNTFFELNPVLEEPHYLQCWLNYYQKDNYIDWHGHWPSELKSWHGFYCVDCEPSCTTYLLPSGTKVDINSENNLLVLSKSEGDKHRTWPWPYSDRPRITIAFDIAPRSSIDFKTWSNHWIPL